MLDTRQRRRFTHDVRARIGLAIVLLIVAAALLAPLISRYDPTDVDLIHLFSRPSNAHWLGTDDQGRDVWARLVYGARVSLAVGFISQAIALSLGIVFGLLAGFFGRWVDELIM